VRSSRRKGKNREEFRVLCPFSGFDRSLFINAESCDRLLPRLRIHVRYAMKRTSTGKGRNFAAMMRSEKEPLSFLGYRGRDGKARVSEEPRWDPGDGPDETFPTYKGRSIKTIKHSKSLQTERESESGSVSRCPHAWKSLQEGPFGFAYDSGFKPTRTDTGAAVGRTRKG
jgi:hypothetical protein